MGKPANYAILFTDRDRVVIRDLGPWSVYLTVTNDAAGVVRRLAPMLNGRHLFYFDSTGDFDELLVNAGEFAGFAPGPR